MAEMTAALPQDQAAGLRRLSAARHLRVLPLVTGVRGVGHTATTINLAAAIGATGARVVILDAGRALIAPALNVKARFELLQLLTGEKRFDEVAHPLGTFDVLPGAKGVEQFIASGAATDDLFGAFTTLSEPYSTVVLAASGDAAAALTPADTELVFVTDDSNDSIKSTYATLKRLSSDFGRHRFRVIYNRIDDDARTKDVHVRLVETARRFFDAEVTLGGVVPNDAAVRRATSAFTHLFRHAQEAPSSPAQRLFARMAAESAEWRLAQFSASTDPALSHSQ